jgi:multidrug resistance efflux pump
MNRAILSFLIFATLQIHAGDLPRKVVCVGRVEPVDGEVEVCARMTGTLVKIYAKEGQRVKAGDVLAEVEAPMEAASLALELARVARMKAGSGAEEIEEAEASVAEAKAGFELARKDHDRSINLARGETRAVTAAQLDGHAAAAESAESRLRVATARLAALKRGFLPEEIAVAEASAALAGTLYELRFVKAVRDGVVLQLYKHEGDYVSVSLPVPILRMAEVKNLQVRLEISEGEAGFIKGGMVGRMQAHSMPGTTATLQITTILPSFAPRRLFEPDSTARMDTRTLNVLASFTGTKGQFFSGQRVMAEIEIVR